MSIAELINIVRTTTMLQPPLVRRPSHSLCSCRPALSSPRMRCPTVHMRRNHLRSRSLMSMARLSSTN
jgi:hypothetical protein